MNDAVADEEEVEDQATIAERRKNPDYRRYVEKLKQLQKIRHGIIKRYFEKFKYKKQHRNDIIRTAEETEEALQEVLGEDHIHFLDANPEIREFLDQVNRD